MRMIANIYGENFTQLKDNSLEHNYWMLLLFALIISIQLKLKIRVSRPPWSQGASGRQSHVDG